MVAALPPHIVRGDGGLDVDGLHVADGVPVAVGVVRIGQLLLAHDPVDLWSYGASEEQY